MRFKVRGRFKMGKEWIKFVKEIEAPSEKLAREYTYSILGSNHKVLRKHVEIEEVVPLGSETD